jgi:hypothetical protein
MPRMEVLVGEMPQLPVGAGRNIDGSNGAAKKPNSVPRKPSYKRPCCKTCKGDSCIGRCKF